MKFEVRKFFISLVYVVQLYRVILSQGAPNFCL